MQAIYRHGIVSLHGAVLSRDSIACARATLYTESLSRYSSGTATYNEFTACHAHNVVQGAMDQVQFQTTNTINVQAAVMFVNQGILPYPKTQQCDVSGDAYVLDSRVLAVPSHLLRQLLTHISLWCCLQRRSYHRLLDRLH